MHEMVIEEIRKVCPLRVAAKPVTTPDGVAGAGTPGTPQLSGKNDIGGGVGALNALDGEDALRKFEMTQSF